MILRDYLETTTFTLNTTIEVIDNTGSMIGYNRRYTLYTMERFFKRIEEHLDNEIKKAVVIPKVRYLLLSLIIELSTKSNNSGIK